VVDVLTSGILGVKCPVSASKVVEGKEARCTGRLIEWLADLLDRDPGGGPGVPTNVVAEAQCAPIDVDGIVLSCPTVH
jgi:hypothetical protein